jgi:hypothetical protein
MPLPLAADPMQSGPHQANASPTNARSVPIPSHLSQQAPIANIICNRDLNLRLYFILQRSTLSHHNLIPLTTRPAHGNPTDHIHCSPKGQIERLRQIKPID